MLQAPPLSLYIHIPWCVQKCPYCDFNSHALKHDIPEQAYIEALLKDLDDDLSRFAVSNRPLTSIFIGGGTPSLFSPASIASLLAQIQQRIAFVESIEITLEANPGTVEAEKFIGFAQAGVTRLSIGVQSFASDKLLTLGRIHDSKQAITAAKLAATCGVNSFNLDLMHGLPKQQVAQALDDLATAISLEPQHLSWYQLTIEPNTAFYSKPPTLPDDDELWAIQQQGVALLAKHGYQQYEISGYSKAGFQCQHNLNYWRFGDYLGIGCGAHGKITLPEHKQIVRTVKVKHPKGYLQSERPALDQLNVVSTEELSFEYMMNRLRLIEAFSLTEFEQRTGLTRTQLANQLKQAQDKGLMQSHNNEQWQVTELGHRYLNELLEMFL